MKANLYNNLGSVIRCAKKTAENAFKVALSFPINKYPKKNVLRNKQTYIIINGSYEGIWVESEPKNQTTLVFLLSNCPQVQTSYMTNPLNNMFGDVGI